MKNAQWIGATIVGAALVFIVTFAYNYVPATDGSGPDRSGGANLDLPQLVFETRKFPSDDGIPFENEHNVASHADFWFVNPHEQPIRFGLVSKNCQCASVQAFFVPDEWKTRRQVRNVAAPAAGLVALAHPGVGDLQLRAQETSLKSARLEATDDGYEVRPGGAGWVRLNWTGEKEGNQLLRTELWFHGKTAQAGTSLEARVTNYPPFRLRESLLQVPSHLTPRDLPYHTSLLCWSPTRFHFRLQAEAVTPRAFEGADPFVVGTPEPLTRDEMDRLEEKFGPVRSGYRVPVTLRDRAGDRPFDVGPFRRLVRLTVPDLPLEPLLIPVVGRVEGDVQVGTREDFGRVLLGTFDSAAGKARTITLATEADGPRLELDRSHVPDYLRVEFPDTPQEVGGRLLWRLTVEVLPGKVNGQFPRDEDPAYRDSAVYVRAHGPMPRLIRIPVEGNAVNR